MDISNLQFLGGNLEGSSVHISRTLMISELEMLFQSTNASSSIDDYKNAIIVENCLLKSTMETRKISFAKMKIAYSLDLNNKLFRMLRTLYELAPEELPLLAFLCVYCRDSILRLSDEHIQTVAQDTEITSDFFSSIIEEEYPGKYSKATLSSMSRNLLSSFYKSGHVNGTKTKKTRSQAKAGPAAVTYAATIAYACGERGLFLCDNEFMRAIDCTKEMALSLLSVADAKGYISLRMLGEVMDIQFEYAEGIV